MSALMIGEIPAITNRKDVYFPVNSLVQRLCTHTSFCNRLF